MDKRTLKFGTSSSKLGVEEKKSKLDDVNKPLKAKSGLYSKTPSRFSSHLSKSTEKKCAESRTNDSNLKKKPRSTAGIKTESKNGGIREIGLLLDDFQKSRLAIGLTLTQLEAAILRAKESPPVSKIPGEESRKFSSMLKEMEGLLQEWSIYFDSAMTRATPSPESTQAECKVVCKEFLPSTDANKGPLTTFSLSFKPQITPSVTPMDQNSSKFNQSKPELSASSPLFSFPETPCMDTDLLGLTSSINSLKLEPQILSQCVDGNKLTANGTFSSLSKPAISSSVTSEANGDNPGLRSFRKKPSNQTPPFSFTASMKPSPPSVFPFVDENESPSSPLKMGFKSSVTSRSKPITTPETTLSKRGSSVQSPAFSFSDVECSDLDLISAIPKPTPQTLFQDSVKSNDGYKSPTMLSPSIHSTLASPKNRISSLSPILSLTKSPLPSPASLRTVDAVDSVSQYTQVSFPFGGTFKSPSNPESPVAKLETDSSVQRNPKRNSLGFSFTEGQAPFFTFSGSQFSDLDLISVTSEMDSMEGMGSPEFLPPLPDPTFERRDINMAQKWKHFNSQRKEPLSLSQKKSTLDSEIQGISVEESSEGELVERENKTHKPLGDVTAVRKMDSGFDFTVASSFNRSEYRLTPGPSSPSPSPSPSSTVQSENTLTLPLSPCDASVSYSSSEDHLQSVNLSTVQEPREGPEFLVAKSRPSIVRNNRIDVSESEEDGSASSEKKSTPERDTRESLVERDTAGGSESSPLHTTADLGALGQFPCEVDSSPPSPFHFTVSSAIADVSFNLLFNSPHVESGSAAITTFQDLLLEERFISLERPVFSTVTAVEIERQMAAFEEFGKMARENYLSGNRRESVGKGEAGRSSHSWNVNRPMGGEDSDESNVDS